MYKRLLLVVIVCSGLLPSVLHAGHVIVVDSPETARSEKEALLILPGFGSKLHGSKDQEKYFAHKGYDLFIPKFLSRKGLDRSAEKLDDFIDAQRLGEYRKIHVFSYIAGSWVLNKWIHAHPENNIATIVYDRSPLQERAPYALIGDMPFLITLATGKIMRDFSETPYPPLYDEKIRKGILIETRATKLIVKRKESALKPGPVSWVVDSLHQPCADYLYAPLDHDQLYSEFEDIGPEIFHFIRQGKFSDGALRTIPEKDPFIRE